MVNTRYVILLLTMLLLVGCAQKQLTYGQAAKMFREGMPTDEVAKVFGKPQFENELGEVTLWNYIPTKEISQAKDAQFTGFVIEIRNNRATKITPTWTVVKPANR